MSWFLSSLCSADLFLREGEDSAALTLTELLQIAPVIGKCSFCLEQRRVWPVQLKARLCSAVACEDHRSHAL